MGYVQISAICSSCSHRSRVVYMYNDEDGDYVIQCSGGNSHEIEQIKIVSDTIILMG